MAELRSPAILYRPLLISIRLGIGIISAYTQPNAHVFAPKAPL